MEGGEKSSRATIGVVFASRWPYRPAGQSATAPSPAAAASEAHSAETETADTAFAEQYGAADAAAAAAASTSGVDIDKQGDNFVMSAMATPMVQHTLYASRL